jgi:hypothetical protein
MAFNWQINPPCEPDMTPWMIVAAMLVPAIIGGVEILKRLKAKREQRRRFNAAIEQLVAKQTPPPPATPGL